MIAAFTDHLWQSTIFVCVAALVAMALRQNRAHIRHAIWLVASMKFLVPLSVLISIGSLFPMMAPAAATPALEVSAAFSDTVEAIAQPFSNDTVVSSAIATSTTETSWLPEAIAMCWALGFVAVVTMRVRGWQRVRSVLRTSQPLSIASPVPVRSAPGLLEPGVIGWRRPVLLVPEGIERQLTPRQLEAVLMHELCHVQRRDNLTSTMHMIVEAVFWFHPLVWFVGARLVDERERACDEFVLNTCGNPAEYAESILNVCKLYVESPVACVSGVSGADLKKRVAAILQNRVGLQLNTARKAALAFAAVGAIALPIALGAATTPRLSGFTQSATTPGKFPTFDVVSVKPCERDAPSQTRNGGGTPITSPGRLYLQCYSLSTMISEAYLYFADGRAHGLSSIRDVGVEGGPAWLKSDRFAIDAKVGQVVPAAVMRGPMLQAILEDRFKLKTRRVSREMPVYELVVGKSGAKVAPYTGTDCVIKDAAAWPPAPLPEGQRYCGDQSRLEGDRFIRTGVMTLDELVGFLPFDRPVVNKTGITAPVSYRLDLVREDTHIGQPPSASWVNAIRNQLGLDLRESKGPRDFLIIDSVERPTPDSPSAHAWPPLADGPASRQAVSDSSRFDVVSIKPCEPNRPPTGPAAPPGFRRGGAPWNATVSPGYAYWDCATLAQLVDQAYADAEHPLLNIIQNPRQDFMNQPKRVRGGPSWVETEKYTLEVKAPVEVTKAALSGGASRTVPFLPAAMSAALRSALEDRFKVRVRRAMEEQSMLALTIAKTGLNKQLITEPVAGDCMTTAQYSAAIADGTAPALEELRLCGRYHSGRDGLLRFTSFTFPQLAKELSSMMDHYVLDKTSVTTPFNFTIKTDAADAASRETAFSRALERMGLKLEPTKGQAEYLVIERAERPTPNFIATQR